MEVYVISTVLQVPLKEGGMVLLRVRCNTRSKKETGLDIMSIHNLYMPRECIQRQSEQRTSVDAEI